MKSLITAMMILPLATAATSETLAQALQQDGPWIDLPEGVVIQTSAPTYADIVALADLDGDPSVMTADEERMIALLAQVMLGTPVAQ
ncbi:hypothetical protein [Yoonia sp. 208BN28-4]|uniref:hypothetical protein n=1 Tax=Yoonia sp. 208BN28-4 TaxID=3126505 RepID=UPI00309F417A